MANRKSHIAKQKNSIMIITRFRSGITIVEIVVWITLFTAIAGIGIIAFNPAGQLAKSRNTQRELHLQAVMNSIRQNIADASGGSFSCASGAIPTSTKIMMSAAGGYNIAPCLVPTYLPAMPYDPSSSTAQYTSVSDYNAGYSIVRNATSGEITVAAPSAELSKTISITR